MTGGITNVSGIRVGHFTDPRRPTGCTVVLAEGGAVGAVDVRGGAPATRETDLLDPIHTVNVVHGVVLAGGSAFGLDAATGVVQWLEARGVGFDTGVARVPIVPAAALFDLGLGDPSIRPDAEAGRSAAAAASDGPVAEGTVGAGAGATVGKLLGVAHAMRGGLGTSSLSRTDGATVGALAVVNALGDVVDPDTGRLVAGARGPDGRTRAGCSRRLAENWKPERPLGGQSTTLVVVATNVALDKPGAAMVARMAHAGLARALDPVHTPWDGDIVFVLATGQVSMAEAPLVAGTMAATAVARAIVRGVRLAEGWPGYPSTRELGFP